MQYIYKVIRQAYNLETNPNYIGLGYKMITVAIKPFNAYEANIYIV